MRKTAERIHGTVAALAPVVGVSVGTLGDSSTVRIEFAPAATTEQRAAAQAALDAFDWSDAAQIAWERGQARLAALASLNTSIAASDVANRCAITDLYAAVNDLRELLNLPRYSHEDVLNRIVTRMLAGGGDPYQ